MATEYMGASSRPRPLPLSGISYDLWDWVPPGSSHLISEKL